MDGSCRFLPHFALCVPYVCVEDRPRNLDTDELAMDEGWAALGVHHHVIEITPADNNGRCGVFLPSIKLHTSRASYLPIDTVCDGVIYLFSFVVCLSFHRNVNSTRRWRRNRRRRRRTHVISWRNEAPSNQPHYSSWRKASSLRSLLVVVSLFLSHLIRRRRDRKMGRFRPPFLVVVVATDNVVISLDTTCAWRRVRKRQMLHLNRDHQENQSAFGILSMTRYFLFQSSRPIN